MAINDESLTNQELIAIAKLGLDRSGHGPSSKQHHVVEQHLFDHKELLARDRDARAGSAARIIEHVPASQPAIESSDNAGD